MLSFLVYKKYVESEREGALMSNRGHICSWTSWLHVLLEKDFIVCSSRKCVEHIAGVDLYWAYYYSSYCRLQHPNDLLSRCHSNWVTAEQTLDHFIFVVGVQYEI